MPVPLFTQTVIAFLWDFDRTLILGNQQEPLFDAYGIDRPPRGPRYSPEGTPVGHSVVSPGIKPMIEGSVIAPHLDGIWANTFIERLAPPGYRERLDVEPGEHPISHLD